MKMRVTGKSCCLIAGYLVCWMGVCPRFSPSVRVFAVEKCGCDCWDQIWEEPHVGQEQHRVQLLSWHQLCCDCSVPSSWRHWWNLADFPSKCTDKWGDARIRSHFCVCLSQLVSEKDLLSAVTRAEHAGFYSADRRVSLSVLEWLL